MSEDFYNIEDVRAEFKCAASTIYRWIEQGAFPKPVKFGRMTRWTAKDIQDFKDMAIQRRNDAGPRPPSIRRGRPAHSATASGCVSQKLSDFKRTTPPYSSKSGKIPQ